MCRLGRARANDTRLAMDCAAAAKAAVLLQA
jgi:hypothetical protein